MFFCTIFCAEGRRCPTIFSFFPQDFSKMLEWGAPSLWTLAQPKKRTKKYLKIYLLDSSYFMFFKNNLMKCWIL